jgi:hypothetical protein
MQKYGKRILLHFYIMHIRQRTRLLKILLGQAAPPASNPIGGTTTPTAVPQTAPAITIQSLPGFNTSLFAVKPAIINNLNTIVNFLNTNIFKLSGGKVNFNLVFTNASVSGSEFTNSLKQLINLSKWIYSVLIYRGPAYTLGGLKQFANELITRARSVSFPDAPDVVQELATMAQGILTQLG